MASEDEIARAARRSAAWKARQAEIAEARREDAEEEKRRRAIKDDERDESPAGNVWRTTLLILSATAVAWLVFEQQTISASAQSCLGGAARPGHYRCADPIVDSTWFWMLSPDTKAMLRASQSQSP